MNFVVPAAQGSKYVSPARAGARPRADLCRTGTILSLPHIHGRAHTATTIFIRPLPTVHYAIRYEAYL